MLTNVSPFAALAAPCTSIEGRGVVIAIVKATFTRVPTGLEIAEEPVPIHVSDVPEFPEAKESSVRYPSDVFDRKAGHRRGTRFRAERRLPRGHAGATERGSVCADLLRRRSPSTCGLRGHRRPLVTSGGARGYLRCEVEANPDAAHAASHAGSRARGHSADGSSYRVTPLAALMAPVARNIIVGRGRASDCPSSASYATKPYFA